jgi:hypothetical protein
MPEERKTTKSLFGNFSDPPFITTDPDPQKTDPYVKTELIPSRYLGRNLATVVPPKGKVPAVFFEKKFLTLASKEQNNGKDDTYEDPYRADRRARSESKKKNIVDKDFKLASYPKKPTGPGSFYGCFQDKPFEHKPEYAVLERGAAPERPKPQPVNVKTNPPKKGTFGFPGTTIEKIKPYDPNQKSDEYDALRKKERALWEAAKKKNIAGNFKLTGLGKVFFDQKQATGISSVFDHYEPKEDGKKKKKPVKDPKEPKVLDLKPWKYSSPGKAGEPGFLNKFPNSKGDSAPPDPYDSVRIKRKEEKEKAPKPLAGIWKPVHGAKESCIKSLLRKFY